MQTTIKKIIKMSGTGLHSGVPSNLIISPASAEYGIWFRRVDISDCDNLIPARYDAVSNTQLCTRISNSDGVEVSTIEHLMAALAGTGIHNAIIDVDGPEIPIMSKCALPSELNHILSGNTFFRDFSKYIFWGDLFFRNVSYVSSSNPVTTLCSTYSGPRSAADLSRRLSFSINPYLLQH